MANKKIIFELSARSADEIADKITESQNAGAMTALVGHRISKRLYNPDALLETALMCVEGFKEGNLYKLLKSLDTEDCNIRLGISPVMGKDTHYVATLEHDYVFPGTQGETDVDDATFNTQNMLEKYFTIMKRR